MGSNSWSGDLVDLDHSRTFTSSSCNVDQFGNRRTRRERERRRINVTGSGQARGSLRTKSLRVLDCSSVTPKALRSHQEEWACPCLRHIRNLSIGERNTVYRETNILNINRYTHRTNKGNGDA